MSIAARSSVENQLQSILAASNYQRFVPVGPEPQPANVYVVRPEHWFIALDTKTGQICKTALVSFPKQEVLDQIPQCTALASGGGATKP
jgi:hypothetical protein